MHGANMKIELLSRIMKNIFKLRYEKLYDADCLYYFTVSTTSHPQTLPVTIQNLQTGPPDGTKLCSLGVRNRIILYNV